MTSDFEKWKSKELEDLPKEDAGNRIARMEVWHDMDKAGFSVQSQEELAKELAEYRNTAYFGKNCFKPVMKESERSHETRLALRWIQQKHGNNRGASGTLSGGATPPVPIWFCPKCKIEFDETKELKEQQQGTCGICFDKGIISHLRQAKAISPPAKSRTLRGAEAGK